MKDLNENQWSFKSSLSIDKQLEDSSSTSQTTSLNLSTTEEEAESKFVRTDRTTDEGLDERSLKHLYSEILSYFLQTLHKFLGLNLN